MTTRPSDRQQPSVPARDERAPSESSGEDPKHWFDDLWSQEDMPAADRIGSTPLDLDEPSSIPAVTADRDEASSIPAVTADHDEPKAPAVTVDTIVGLPPGPAPAEAWEELSMRSVLPMRETELVTPTDRTIRGTPPPPPRPQKPARDRAPEVAPRSLAATAPLERSEPDLMALCEPAIANPIALPAEPSAAAEPRRTSTRAIWIAAITVLLGINAYLLFNRRAVVLTQPVIVVAPASEADHRDVPVAPGPVATPVGPTDNVVPTPDDTPPERMPSDVPVPEKPDDVIAVDDPEPSPEAIADPPTPVKPRKDPKRPKPRPPTDNGDDAPSPAATEPASPPVDPAPAPTPSTPPPPKTVSPFDDPPASD